MIAIVVTHNSAGFVRQAVESLSAQKITTIVIDNASKDTTLKEIPPGDDIHLIANVRNCGFAAAVNQAVSAFPARNYLLLNPDAVLLDPLEPLTAAVDTNGHSAAAGLLVDEAGIPQKGFSFRRLPTARALAFEVLGLNRIWPGNAVNRWYRCLDADLRQPQLVEQPAGAFLLFRRTDWERLGGFDEGFFPIWFEDVDFCRRLGAAGGTIWFDPSVRARHHGGHSVQNVGVQSRQIFWCASLLRYAALHFPQASRRGVAICVAVAAVPRALILGRGQQWQSLKSIWRLAWRSFWSGGVETHRAATRENSPGNT